MKCLAKAEYDPAVAVNASLATAIVMTAFDTTNLRLTFTAPASGLVQVRIRAATGATTPTYLLGVLEGATVVFRAAPIGGIPRASTQTGITFSSEVSAVVAVTAGSHTYDAAYGVETTSASNISYGGPDNTTVTDAWGALQFEVFEA